MRAIKINVEKQIFEEIEIKDWTEIAPAIGNKCEIFTCPITLENGDTMYCDDEALFTEQCGGIIMKDWLYPLLGNIILLNADKEGNNTPAVSQIEKLKKQIAFLTKEQTNEYQQFFF
jgi:hypothetical protein